MNLTQKSQERWESISHAVSRFWFSTGAFLLATLVIMIGTEQQEFWEKQITCIFLAGSLGILAQLIYELFFQKNKMVQWSLYVGACLFSVGYYMYLRPNELFEYSAGIRTGVLFFIVLITVLWLPSIRQDEYAFSRSFIVFVKAFFTSFLFSLVLYIGLMAILSAFNFLITSIDYKIYSHISALTWSGFFPIYFLSLMPVFPTGKEVPNEKYLRATTIPKFFEILLTYIIIPVIAIYTLILLLYILQNITGEFWNNSLLDPLLISYVIIGWFSLFSIDTLENQIVRLFRKYFPLLLFVVTGFQGVATLNKIRQIGLTDGRYFILLFVLFSIVSSGIYLLRHSKMFLIPGLLILLSVLSIFPGIDAVSVASRSQANQLEATLTANNMLQNNSIKADGTIPERDKKKIVESYRYLRRVDRLSEVDFLPQNYLNNTEFIKTFGFSIFSLEEEGYPGGNEPFTPKSFTLSADPDDVLQFNVEDQDVLLPLYVDRGNFSQVNTNQLPIIYQDKTYQLIWQNSLGEQLDEENVQQDQLQLILEDEDGQQLANYDLHFLTELEELEQSYQEFSKPLDELTFTEEFPEVTITLSFTNLYVEESNYLTADFYLMLSFH